MQHSAIFFDRDGTLNEDPGYLSNPSEVKLYPGTAEALAILKNELNFKLIVISNQSGIARGLITREIVESIHDRINELLIDSKVSIDAFYYCPFHPEYSTKEEASCRKPSPEMVLKAARENDIELSNSYFVGDSVSDIECGKNSGLKTILVKTGYGEESISILQKQNNFPTFVAKNILDACEFIQKDYRGEN